jgi:putative phage-type endonuclease
MDLNICETAGIDLYQDLEYILKDVTKGLDPSLIRDSPDDREEIISLCIITISNIYDDINETNIRTFLNNILAKIGQDGKLAFDRVLEQDLASEQDVDDATDDVEELSDEEIITLSVHDEPTQTVAEDRSKKEKDNLVKIENFMKLPQYKQKSREWLDQRNNYLTASTIAAALGLMGPAARRDLLLNKVSFGELNKFRGNSACHWGNKYEPVANALYCYKNNVKVYEFGMIPSDKYNHLGVSPDGITSAGRMLEIKCPYSRVIDGKIKTEYYHQMQEQMAVCDYDECDFLEVKLTEVSEHQFWEDFYYYDPEENENREKGITICYLDMNDIDPDTKEPNMDYMYSPIEYHKDKEKMREWQAQTIKELVESDKYIMIGSSYWSLLVYNCQTVNRDPDWIVSNYPILSEFWNEVEHYRDVGVDKLLEKIEKDKELIEKKKREKKEAAAAKKKTTRRRVVRRVVRKKSSSTSKSSGDSPDFGGVCQL